jgi:hypothetical protein
VTDIFPRAFEQRMRIFSLLAVATVTGLVILLLVKGTEKK